MHHFRLPRRGEEWHISDFAMLCIAKTAVRNTQTAGVQVTAKQGGRAVDHQHIVKLQQVIVVLVQLDAGEQAVVFLQRLLGDQGFQGDGCKNGVLPMPDSRPTAGVRLCMGLSMQIYIFSASLIWLVSTMWVMVS